MASFKANGLFATAGNTVARIYYNNITTGCRCNLESYRTRRLGCISLGLIDLWMFRFLRCS